MSTTTTTTTTTAGGATTTTTTTTTSSSATEEEGVPPAGKWHINYFPVWAKGPAIALALDHAGVDWEGVHVKEGGTMETLLEDWTEVKPTTAWGELPVLTVPGLSPIAHELTILNYIGRKCGLEGKDDSEYTISGQLMQMGEDIYNALVRVQPTSFDPKTEIVAAGKTAAFWSNSDETKHNLEQGVAVYLSHLERFHGACDNGVAYTSSGNTVGECKLFAMLHALKLIKDDALAGFPKVETFYSHFAAMPASKAVLDDGSKFPSAFLQYFIEPK